MKENKTREFFETHDFENQNSQEHTDANERLVVKFGTTNVV